MGSDWSCDRCGEAQPSRTAVVGCNFRFIGPDELCKGCFREYREWRKNGDKTKVLGST